MDIPNRSQKRAATIDGGALASSIEDGQRKRRAIEAPLHASETGVSVRGLVAAALKAPPVAAAKDPQVFKQLYARDPNNRVGGVPAVWGATAVSTPASKESDSTALAQFHEALDLIPKKDDYLEALRRVPFLVMKESPAVRFLQCEDNNPGAAAKRLVAYWKQRRALFGERAFLPIDLTGNGALTTQDIAVLNTGFVAMLPSDRDDNLVLYYDRDRLGDATLHSKESRLRTLFYYCQVASEHPKANARGIVAVCILNASSFKLNQGVIAAGFRLISAMPVTWLNWHILNRPSNVRKRSLIDSSLQLAMATTGNYFWKSTNVHIGEKDELLASLLKHRLTKEGLPELLGGTWTFDRCEKWKRERIAVEEKRHTVFREHYPFVAKETSPGVSVVQETPETRKKALEELEDALGLIDDESKAALMEARELIPDLANKEADPIRFLRFEGYNTWAAARRLAKYWSKRKELFGKRAFLPMNQTGEGTLNRQDLAALSSGYVVFLHNDLAGRTVACTDSSRRHIESPVTRLRVWFYVGTLLCENDKTQTDGAVFLSIIGVPKFDKLSATLAKLIFDNFPFKLHMHHIVNYIDPDNKTGTKKSYMETFVPLLMRLVGSVLGQNTIVHVGKTADELGNKLQAYEFKKESLPKCTGGQWDYSEFPEWQDLRMRYEWELPPGAAHKDNGYDVNYTEAPYAGLTEEEKTERKRRLNVLHSRRKRERRKIEAEVISDQVDQLEASNKRLAEENRHFEEMLKDANARVAGIESGRYRENQVAGSAAVASAPKRLDETEGVACVPLARISAERMQMLTEQLLLRESLEQQSRQQTQQAMIQRALAEQLPTELTTLGSLGGLSTRGLLLQQQVLDQRLLEKQFLERQLLEQRYVRSQAALGASSQLPLSDVQQYAALAAYQSALAPALTLQPSFLYSDEAARLSAAASLRYAMQPQVAASNIPSGLVDLSSLVPRPLVPPFAGSVREPTDAEKIAQYLSQANLATRPGEYPASETGYR